MRHKHTWFIKNFLFHGSVNGFRGGFYRRTNPLFISHFYNNFWDKLMKKDPQTKSIYGQELLDQIAATIKEYNRIPNKGMLTDDSTSVNHMARRISNHDKEEQNKMILDYLEEIKRLFFLI
ncbi:hypothetical protein H5410_002450 [Solanum commersonii]|uniref:Uncharacterized protein n=1 Tax=Solanum commersonii TaxID=4109 RepID=A0A9J6B1T1_SOLCO|nr:hypothetical protein H5410_002450 [Solanum commersonii]